MLKLCKNYMNKNMLKQKGHKPSYSMETIRSDFALILLLLIKCDTELLCGTHTTCYITGDL